jgi:hypothetical protein
MESAFHSRRPNSFRPTKSPVARLCTLALLLVASGLTSTAQAAPAAFWVSQPVAPNETVVVSSGNTTSSANVLVSRFNDDAPGSPLSGVSTNDGWQSITPLQATISTLKFLLPNAKPGVYGFQITDGGQTGSTTLINAPDIWFIQGDQGWAASPGGTLNVYGTALGIPSATSTYPVQIALVQNGKVVTTLKANSVNAKQAAYGISFSIPTNLAPGQYTLYLHNGFGGPSAWRQYSSVGYGPAFLSPTQTINTVTIAASAVWPTTVCAVAAPKGNGAADDASFKSAFACAQKAGGAIISMASGTYTLSGIYKQGFGKIIQDHSIIRGKGNTGAKATTLSFPAMTGATSAMMAGFAQYIPYPPEYGTGTQYIEGIYSVENVILSAPKMTSGNAILMENMALADSNWSPYIDHVTMVIGKSSNNPTAIKLFNGVSNVRITNSNITAAFPIGMDTRIFGTFIDNNVINWTNEGMTAEHVVQNTVVTNNTFILPKTNLTPGVTVGLASPNRDVFYANNTETTLGSTNFWGMTFDEGNGIYFGYAASADGNTLTLASPVQLLPYRPDPTGNSVMIMSGTGAGQMRYVVGNPTPTTLTLDQPWDVNPDSTSVISVCNTMGRVLFVNNSYGADLENNAFFPSADVIEANNIMSGKTNLLIMQAGDYMGPQGIMPGWHYQILGNSITKGTGALASQGTTASFLPGQPNAWYTGSVTQGSIIRDNTFAKSVTGSISFDGMMSNSLIENNIIPSIDIQSATINDSLLKGNKTSAGQAPKITNTSPGTTVIP